MATTAASGHGHATTEHKAHPNYMNIFWVLLVLTIVELGVVFLPFGKFTNGTLLCALALVKAAVVAMYFMHLRFELRTLAMIAVTPLVIATLLLFVLMPDAFAVAHKSNVKKTAETSEKKH
jgi:cytochrome c oxidase subunit IV